jgi:hypothetical protein
MKATLRPHYLGLCDVALELYQSYVYELFLLAFGYTMPS